MIGLSPLGLQAKGFLKSRVDERMELLSIVMRLAGVPEYSNGMTPEYNQCVDEFLRLIRIILWLLLPERCGGNMLFAGMPF